MKNEIREINEGGLGKRLVALIMDAVIFLFTWGILSVWVMTPIANKAFSYEKNMANAQQRQVFSELFVLEKTINKEQIVVEIDEFDKIEKNVETSVTPLYEKSYDDLDEYKNRIKYYYLNYKTRENLKIPTDFVGKDVEANFYDASYLDQITLDSGSKVSRSEYYTETWFNETFGALSTKKEWQNAAYEATSDFYYSDCYTKLMNSIKGSQIFITIPTYVLCFFAYYFLVPLLFKNGETLAKKVVHLGFVTKDGYQIKKRQMVMRQLLLFLWVSLSAFVVGFGLTSFATLGVGVVLYLVLTLINKKRRSPIDLAAYLLLVDTQTSVWFETPEEEEKKQKELEEKMAKYRKVEIPNKNIIQIGGKVIEKEETTEK